jgi:enoyl-CoA hydratase/carnithine racemase
MSETAVKYETVELVSIIALNRPGRRNAINNDIALGLRAAWERFNASDERVAILTHAGEHFSVGVDVNGPAEDFPACVPNVRVRLAKPLIAGLAARIPHKVAMELMLLGDELGAERAYQVGLVNKVVPQAQLRAAAIMHYAQRLAENAPLVLSLLREFVSEVIPQELSEHVARGRNERRAPRQLRGLCLIAVEPHPRIERTTLNPGSPQGDYAWIHRTPSPPRPRRKARTSARPGRAPRSWSST